jgi:hypothetical protein
MVGRVRKCAQHRSNRRHLAEAVQVGMSSAARSTTGTSHLDVFDAAGLARRAVREDSRLSAQSLTPRCETR